MKAHRKEDFAADVSSQLVRCLRETQATRVYVLADPEFLGLLRQRMDARTRGCVVGEIDKSVARHSPAQIRTSLPSLL
jgi:protein required for attachment to host cells